MSIQSAPTDWIVRPRARSAGISPFASFSKHYSRTVHHIVPGGHVLDLGESYERQRRANPADNNVVQSADYQRYFLPLRNKFGPELDDQIINDQDGSFRQKCAGEFHKGRSQGRTDDLVCLKKVLSAHAVFRDLPNNFVAGFSSDIHASLLRTPGLDLDSAELRTALNAGIVDAPANQLFAGLFRDYRFPNQHAHPLTGAFESELFIDVYLGIFLGPRAAQHLTPGSGGRRSKAQKNGMTEVTKPSIAYVAMLLRFCLQRHESWYTVESNVDTRYNYFVLYTEILALLEEPVFVPQINQIMNRLNNVVFPNHHNLPPNHPTNNGPSALQAALAHVNALAGGGH